MVCHMVPDAGDQLFCKTYLKPHAQHSVSKTLLPVEIQLKQTNDRMKKAPTRSNILAFQCLKIPLVKVKQLSIHSKFSMNIDF